MDFQIKSFINFLILFSFVGLVFIFGPLLGVEARYSFKSIVGSGFDVSAIPESEFSLVIPKIGAKAEVFKNVNAAKYNEYIKFLRKGVAHAKGTGLPGEKKNIFLFAHSSIFPWEAGRVNPVFYLLNKLENNDLIYLYYQREKYTYKVIEKRIINPKEVEDINHPKNQGRLILQTCWPPGTSFKRLLVLAEKID